MRLYNVSLLPKNFCKGAESETSGLTVLAGLAIVPSASSCSCGVPAGRMGDGVIARRVVSRPTGLALTEHQRGVHPISRLARVISQRSLWFPDFFLWC